MAATALTVAAANPTNPRIDMVCANVVDTGNSSDLSGFACSPAHRHLARACRT